MTANDPAAPPAPAAVAPPIDRDARLGEAARIIASATRWSAATGVIPVPLLDLAALAGVQASMIARLANLYGETLSDNAARSIVSVLLGTLLPANLAAGVVGSTVKLVPGAGYFIGTASMVALSAAATYAIGKVFVGHFEGGGTLATFSADAVKDELKREYQSARARKDAAAPEAAAVAQPA
jgi:uncharacterized protein (DUF697 family)